MSTGNCWGKTRFVKKSYTFLLLCGFWTKNFGVFLGCVFLGGVVKTAFYVPGVKFKRKKTLVKITIFIIFDIWKDDLRSPGKNFRQGFQNCLLRVQKFLPRIFWTNQIFSFWTLTFFFGFGENVSARLWKLLSICPQQHFHEKHFWTKNSILFSRFHREHFRCLDINFQQGCQNCFLRVQRTFSRKI